MNKVRLFKLILTIGLSFCFVFGGVQLLLLDVKSASFGPNILTGTFVFSLLLVLSMYRIHWIGQQKVDWIALILGLSTALLLLAMRLAPENVLALWKVTVSLFILFNGYILFRKIPAKGYLSIVAKSFLLISCAILLYAIVMQISSPVYYEIAFYALFLTAVMSAVQVFLPSSKTSQDF